MKNKMLGGITKEYIKSQQKTIEKIRKTQPDLYFIMTNTLYGKYSFGYTKMMNKCINCQEAVEHDSAYINLCIQCDREGFE